MDVAVELGFVQKGWVSGKGANRAKAIENILVAGARAASHEKWENAALLLVARYGKTEMLARLLELGANPNARDLSGHTPLILASWRGHKPSVEILLESEADPMLRDGWGFNAHARAHQAGHQEITSMLKYYKESYQQ